MTHSTGTMLIAVAAATATLHAQDGDVTTEELVVGELRDARAAIDSAIALLEHDPPAREPKIPRLIAFVGVGVGGAQGAPECGTTAPAAWTPDEGWLAMEPSIARVREIAGDREFGISLHHPWGVWPGHYRFGPAENVKENGMVFEQRLLALEHCTHPTLRTDLEPLDELLTTYGIEWRQAYLGAPRCGEKPDWPEWVPVPAHCERPFYEAALFGLEAAGFDAITFDALANQNTPDSPVWDTVAPWVAERFLLGQESLPPRELGYVFDHGARVVWVQARALQRRDGDPTYFQIEELRERGIAVICAVNQPPSDWRGDSVPAWQHETALRLLEEGRVTSVATNLAWQAASGLDLEALFRAAER